MGSLFDLRATRRPASLLRRMFQASFGAAPRSRPPSGREVARLAVTEGAGATQEIHLAIGKGIGKALCETYGYALICREYSNIQAPQAPSPDFVAGTKNVSGTLRSNEITTALPSHQRDGSEE